MMPDFSSRLLLGLCIAWFCQSPTLAEESLYSRRWDAASSDSLQIHPPSDQDVESFVSRLLNEQPHFRDYPYNSETTGFLTLKDGFKLCGRKFAKLPALKQKDDYKDAYVLLVLLGAKSATSCGEILVISQQEDMKFGIHQIAQAGFAIGPGPAFADWSAIDLDKAVQTLDGSDTPILVINELLYSGKDHAGDCKASFPTEYIWWDHTQFTRDDAHSHAFYEVYQKKFDAATAGKTITPCSQMERDKITRLLSTDPKAGFARSVEWAKSSDPKLRLKAVIVFQDIRDKQSMEQISALKNDPDPGIADLVYAILNPLQQTF